METNYKKENEQFKTWWDKITAKSDKWTTLERMAAHDAWMEARGVFKKLTIPVASNNEVALKSFVEEYVEAFEDGQGSDTALYRQAKSLL